MKEFLQKHKIKLGIICATITLAVGGFFILPNDYKVFSKIDGVEIELGSQINNDINTYIWGIESAVNEATLDSSHVDLFTAGDYQLYVKIGNRSIPYNVKVVDTVAPVLTLDSEVQYLAVEREYEVEKFVADVSDLSNTSEVYFKVNDSLVDTISFDATGEHTITFVAKDVSGNVAEQSTTITVEVPPRFMGLADTTIPVGAAFDYEQAFIIYDETDGFITDSVIIDDEGVNFSEAGTYEVVYSVENSRGVDNTKTIYITTSEDATDDYKYETNLTSEDWDILVENEYFSYELLEEGNTDKDLVTELVKPICINISKNYSDGSKVTGSAFVYKIDEEYVYGLSVEHVLDAINQNCYLTFHNDISIQTSVEYEHLGSNSELAIFRFKTSELPKETLLTLKEAYIDTGCYDTLEGGTPLLAYVENHGFYQEFKKVIKSVTVINANAENHPDMGLNYPALATTRGAISGMSGGPIVDYQGRVVGSASYFTISTARDYYMKIDVIDELVEKFNEKYD